MDKITAQIYNAIREQEWRRKMINKPIEYVEKINPYSISSVRQRLIIKEKIMIKEKVCKGQGKAIGAESCGKMVTVEYRKHGLCPNCYAGFLFEDERGKIIYQKTLIRATEIVKKDREKQSKEKDKASRLKLMTADKYRATILQPIINEIARLIDYDQPCIATGNYGGKMSGGHYRSVGSNRTIALNLHNIHNQSFESNVHKSGDSIRYREGVIETYGIQYFDFMDSLVKHRPLKLLKSEMTTIYSEAIKVRNELKRNLQQLTSYERIEMRDRVNERLNIYDNEFSQFYGTKTTRGI